MAGHRFHVVVLWLPLIIRGVAARTRGNRWFSFCRRLFRFNRRRALIIFPAYRSPAAAAARCSSNIPAPARLGRRVSRFLLFGAGFGGVFFLSTWGLVAVLLALRMDDIVGVDFFVFPPLLILPFLSCIPT